MICYDAICYAMICYIMCSRIDRGEERSDGLDCSGGPGEWDCTGD
jgi:hypothetical protein